MSLSPEVVAAASAVLEGVARRTPVLSVPEMDERLQAEVFFKCEQLQRCGAFKFRGAYHAAFRTPAPDRIRGLLTYSSGNHASGLALAGQLLGAPVSIAMPVTASAVKRDLARSFGAEIIDCNARDREEVGRRVAGERGLTVIPPYDHEDIIAGQGTAARELLAEVGPLDLVLVPVGGGGLLAGTALAAAAPGAGAARPRVVGVEPELGDDAYRSFRAGRVVALEEVPDTIADGLRTRFIGERNLAVFREFVDDVVTVSEDEILDALAWLWKRGRQLVEPSSAVPLAALLSGKVDGTGQRIGIILSGGNCDPAEVWSLVADRELS